MNQRFYRRVLELLVDAGISTSEARYRSKVFGSWVIELATQPTLRIHWDGRDGGLLVFARVGPTALTSDEWRQMWVAETPREVTPDRVIEEVRELMDRDLGTEMAASNEALRQLLKES